jgi:predicted nucleic acid-binding protein
VIADTAAVVDTMVLSYLMLDPLPPLARAYRDHHLVGLRLIVAAQTAAELRAGARLASWGDRRMAALEDRLSRLRVAGVDGATIDAYAELKHNCVKAGHALGAKAHDGDRWIAATARRYDIPLVSHDSIFRNVAGLDVRTELERP